jgi:uncharacterized repeat protein (TIGR04052 family)
MKRIMRGALLAGLAACSTLEPTQPIAVRFAGMVGDQPFACGQSYQGVGARNSRITPSDFRFYVSEVALIDAQGRAVPVTLAQDGVWQHADVALIDFENRTGPCLTGTAETNDVVRGTVPPGTYTGLRFTMAVPPGLNHADSTVAPSPLNLASMFWNWQAGYKFLRIDLATAGRPQSIRAGDVPRFGDAAGSNRLGFAVHVGSTQCASAGPGTPPTEPCRNPNRARIELTGFDPARNVVVADMRPLLAGVNLEMNQPNTPAGCMSSPSDADCNPLMHILGLPFGGQPSPGQRFFRVQ